MTLPSEVVRVLAKDLRVLRWPLTAWCGLLALSIFRGLDVLPSLHEALFPIAWIVPMLAAALVGYAVTQDPPVEGPTFWGVHRQQPLAVAGAKAMLALVLLVAMAGGHALVLASHGLSPMQVTVLVADVARDAAAWLLFSAALAACARNAAGWLIGAALAATLAVLIPLVAGHEFGVPPTWALTPASAALSLTAISVMVLVWTYRAHLTGLRSGARNALLLVVPTGMAMRSPGPHDPVMGHATQSDAAMIVHTDRVVSRIDRRAVVVEMPVTYPDSSVVSAVTVAWRLQLRDGSAIHLLPGGARVRRGTLLLQPEGNVALWGRGPVTRTLEFHFPLDSLTLAQVAGNLTEVTMALETDRVTMRRIASFAAAEGGTVAFDGGRLRIGAVGPDGRFPMHTSSVGTPPGVSTLPWSATYLARPILALQSGDARDVRVLKPVGAATRAGMRSGSWVLPGNEMRGHAAVLVPAGSTAPVTGNVIALAGVYAGRSERAIRAPVAR
ncbi:MAG: hypothetical protein V4813_00540 [Gemmatimonadota bacterium]